MNYAQMIIPFIGGLALFIYGMNIMAQGLQNAPAPNEEYFGSTDTEQIDGDCSGCIGNSHCTEFLRNNRYGRWFCKCWFDEPDTGHECYHGCQHWYNCNRLAGIQFRMGKDVQPRNHCTSGGYAGCHLDDER